MTLIELGRILRGEKVETKDRIIQDLSQLEEIVDYLRQSGFRITATTGVWDLLHVGHCRYLNATRQKGHINIVEVDSDEVVRRRKPDNPNRPVVPMTERIEMLTWARPVDLIYPLPLDEDPIEFIRVMHPDVFVVSETSGDSKEEYLSLVRDHCGEIVVLPAQANISSTERIRRMMVAGGVDQLIEVREIVTRMIQAIEDDNQGG